ncbi:hypothetical protein B0H16DRAFT_163543 [Mycena metata]|uniref:DUF6535 domain-containing protein n=1 Tax=Mycena metata TaxID=1033252 RepID=A0AAD7MW68_9AGAR|nr:hypothetical protein B0H16DRAFT_163543 [Mycena metata]
MSTTANSAAASDSDRLITALQSLAKKQEGQGEKLYRAVPTTDKNAAFWNPWYSTDFQKNLDLDWALIFCIILASIELGFLHIIQIESQLAVEHSPTLFVVVQSMLYISLFATFLAALIVASGQHWPPNHQAAGSRGTAVEQRGLGRHYELDGSVTWRSKAVLQGFPLLLQLALMLSMSSISVYLITVHHPVAILVTVLIALGLGSYIFLLVSATIFPNCPFQTPLGSILVSCIKAVKSVLFHQQGEQGKKLYRMVEAPTTDNKKAAFWNSYMKLANKHDKEFQQKYGSGFDTALVFCCFFMAVEPEFISKIEPQLAVEYPPTIIVIVQSMMYISLFAALLAALLAVLGKQWLVYYQAAGTGTIEECGLKRQHKLDGLVQWKFEALLQGIPLLLQLALFLFT